MKEDGTNIWRETIDSPGSGTNKFNVIHFKIEKLRGSKPPKPSNQFHTLCRNKIIGGLKRGT